MKERPILFSGPMVRAILEGRKTQTRRFFNPKRCPAPGCMDAWEVPGVKGTFGCPYGSEDDEDRLWVKETFAAHVDYPDALTMPEYEGGHNPERLLYRADQHRKLTRHYGIPWESVKWRPSIFMPRWASRITLEVTDVRLERLQDIPPEDVPREGISLPRCGCEPCSRSATMCPADAGAHVEEFWHLWDSINGKRAPWGSNPWVWVISFRNTASPAHPRPAPRER